MGREVFVVDWKKQNTPLGLAGQRQAVCTRTFFVPLDEALDDKPPEIHYYVTSLPLRQASPERLAKLIRGHWGIENRLHHVKDRTFLEDRHWLKNRATAITMTCLRSTVVGLLHSFHIPGCTHRAHVPEKIQYMQANANRPLHVVCGKS